MHRFTFVSILLLLVSLVFATCPGTTPNSFEPITTPPVLQSSVPNGKLYMVTDVNPPIRVLHTWGTAYERGLATGQLLKKDLNAFLPKVPTYMDNKLEAVLEEYIPFMPSWLAKYIATNGISLGLELTYNMTKPFTPQHFIDEIRGISDGSGVPQQLITKLNMIPELIKAACSMVGAWGPAIKETKIGNTLFQLRALDWDTEGPFADYPLVTITHPPEDEGHAYATFGWTGFVGALTGYSSAKLGICEKWWASYNGTYFVEGYPFHYLLRDILQFDPDSSAALNRILNAQRTCAIFIGLGDDNTNQFRAVEYSHDIINVFSDKSYPYYPEHPRMEGLVYIDKYMQPSRRTCLADLLKARYGHIDAKALIEVASLLKTGDAHAAIYDFAGNFMYVAAASSPQVSPVIGAYDRPFVRLDMTKLFSEQKP